ncbi:terminase small subunit [Hafnia paralvei]|uniref:terminase small subunit n=1 Tax=Hafnia paralvei TaxID=546367 RepID=UPI001F45F4C7|nr:terminase small subunit [Hafnia paralvei]MCE9882036.1 terminase small subunit [Hafnia paralvei]MCE9906013.1 terminase small subunit [Hafnia paralvei]MCE9911990.1 terminase small subunit [Hafnia paralvei]
MELTEHQKALFDAMTKSQQKFALGIVEGLTQIDAYRKAGGKAKKEENAHASASEIYRNPKVRAFVDEMNKVAISDAVMTRQEALERLSLMARASLHEMVEFSEAECGTDDNGNPIIQAGWRFKNSALQSAGALSAISELTAGKRGISIKLHDPKAAIKQLADLQGWEPPKESKLTITATKPLSELFEDDDA